MGRKCEWGDGQEGRGVLDASMWGLGRNQKVVLAGHGEEVPCTHSGWQVWLQKVQWLVDMVETWWLTDR